MLMVWPSEPADLCRTSSCLSVLAGLEDTLTFECPVVCPAFINYYYCKHCYYHKEKWLDVWKLQMRYYLSLGKYHSGNLLLMTVLKKINPLRMENVQLMNEIPSWLLMPLPCFFVCKAQLLTQFAKNRETSPFKCVGWNGPWHWRSWRRHWAWSKFLDWTDDVHLLCVFVVSSLTCWKWTVWRGSWWTFLYCRILHPTSLTPWT